MATDPFDTYLEMESVWQSKIPKRLQGIKPRILIALLNLAAPAEGISQSAAASKLGLTQWGVSKISRKLIGERWVTVVRGTKPNHRQKLMTTTPKAGLIIKQLQAQLGGAMTRSVVPKAGSKKRPHPGMPANARSLFDPPTDDQ